jgi:MoxR-like ATPase
MSSNAPLVPDPLPAPRDAAELSRILAQVGYPAGDGTATAAFLATVLQRPLLLEGEPGVGKTALAQALAEGLHLTLVRLQCYEGIDVSQALYDWDFPRQLLALRGGDGGTVDPRPRQVYAEEFLVRRPLLQALEGPPCLLLIDEIDRADDAFEAFLLELLSDFAVTIPEIGTIRAQRRPLVILTSNRTRDLHDALRRRCLYHWVPLPDPDRELAIIRSHLPEVSSSLAGEVAAAVETLRGLTLNKAPGVAETIDWASALTVLGVSTLDEPALTATLGAVIKDHDDLVTVTSSSVVEQLTRGPSSP